MPTSTIILIILGAVALISIIALLTIPKSDKEKDSAPVPTETPGTSDGTGSDVVPSAALKWPVGPGRDLEPERKPDPVVSTKEKRNPNPPAEPVDPDRSREIYSYEPRVSVLVCSSCGVENAALERCCRVCGQALPRYGR